MVDGAGYAFRHTLTRDAVYDDMLPGERTGLHRAYADAVAADPSLAGDEGSAAAALAHHSYAAHDLPQTLAAAVNAARHATGAYAPADAERHLERAMEVWAQVPDAEERAGMDRVGVIELAIEAAISTGDEGRALALVDDALADVDRVAEAARVALLLDRRAEAVRWLGRGNGIPELEEAVRLLPSEPATPELASVLASLAGARMLNAEIAEGAEVARRALEAARAVGDPRSEASALTSLGSSLCYLGEADAGLDALQEALDVATQVEDHAAALRAYTNLSDGLEAVGRHHEASDVARAGLALAQRVGLAGHWAVYLAYNAAEPLIRLGRWSEADDLLAESTERNPPGARSLPLHVLRARIALWRGRLDDATTQFERTRRVAGKELDYQSAADLALLEAELQHARGDLDGARATVGQFVSEHAGTAIARELWPMVWLGLRVEADMATLARDRRQPADPDDEAGAERLTKVAGDRPTLSPESKGYAALVSAERERVAGEPGREAWRAAATAWRSAGDPYPLAYALLRVGEAELAEGDRAAAADAVREAAELARGIGAAPLAEEATTLAQRARLSLEVEPSEAEAPEEPAPFGLTERELEVLRLIAAGQTNREIGGTLYMSPKTASAHVSRILSKLGVSGRVEAAAVAHRLGLSEDP